MKRNLLTALLGLGGIGASGLADNSGLLPLGGTGKGGRMRSSQRRRDRLEHEFRDAVASEFKTPKHLKLAHKAFMGEIGLPHGRRGLMVRRIKGKMVITA